MVLTVSWQDYMVWAIGLAIAVALIRRLVCLFRGRGKGGCSSCASTECPLHKRTDDKRKGQAGNDR